MYKIINIMSFLKHIFKTFLKYVFHTQSVKKSQSSTIHKYSACILLFYMVYKICKHMIFINIINKF